AYTALASGRIDGTDVYTTDAQIARLGLVALEDDRGFFPRYDAVWLYRLDLARRQPPALDVLRAFAGPIHEPEMIRATARVVLDQQDERAAARSLVGEAWPEAASTRASSAPDAWRDIARRTAEHVRLVALSLLLAVLVGVPLGVVAARSPSLARV